MNNEKEIRNFYQEEAEYEKSILEVKQIIEKIKSIDIEIFNEKLNLINKSVQYKEFVDLLIAVIGRKTNKYYYCKTEEDSSYYNLELKKVYRIDELNIDLKEKFFQETQLDLEARAILADRLLILTKELKGLFSANVLKSDGSLATIETVIITQEDVSDLETLIKYLELMKDKTGRLKILVAERDIHVLERVKEEYNKKSSVEKWVYKIFNKEKTVIRKMAENNKGKN